MGRNKKEFELTKEQSDELARIYNGNKRLFYFLAGKYTFNEEKKQDMIQDVLLWISRMMTAECFSKSEGIKPYIYWGFKSVYKDRGRNEKELGLVYGDIVDDTDFDEYAERGVSYIVPTTEPEDMFRNETADSVLEYIKDDKTRELLRAKIYEDVNYVDTAKKLGISSGCADSKLHAVRRRDGGKIKKYLADE